MQTTEGVDKAVRFIIDRVEDYSNQQGFNFRTIKEIVDICIGVYELGDKKFIKFLSDEKFLRGLEELNLWKEFLARPTSELIQLKQDLQKIKDKLASQNR